MSRDFSSVPMGSHTRELINNLLGMIDGTGNITIKMWFIHSCSFRQLPLATGRLK